MTSADAFKVLGCEVGASREAITRQYQGQYTELQVRLDNAPTPQLKRLYQDKLQELEAAYQTFKSLPQTEAVDVEVPSPSLTPLPSPPPSPTKPWWVPWGIGAVLAVVVGVVVWVVMQDQATRERQRLIAELKIGMQFVLIPAGEFMMGSNDGRNDEQPVHRVCLTKPFYLGKYEVTQGEWKKVMGNNLSQHKGDPRRPVENVAWDDVQGFINRLNARESGARYRLPTEAEWEYAARAGSISVYSFGDDARQLGAYAWYGDNASSTTHPVGQKLSNAWGLYDMHGNVWEWVQD
jgi:formylglycine-generating enzyme required for sulfatase activity